MIDYTGKRLDGRYEIHEVIGMGGMAVVYKAYDNISDRIVSVKILKDEYLANEEFRRRFKNESKAISMLSHPNIVKVYDVSYGDKLQYIVMEYVEGITLKEYIRQQGRLEVREAVHFTMQILRALQHAHDKGVVHRDIKPQNIMLLPNGTIKVTDFGIARFSCSEVKTVTDSAIGSVHYISPEQARGDVTDDKTDIYAVGVVLYEMLTGKVPFESESSLSVAMMQLQKDPVRPREIIGTVPVGLEQITMRAMQKNTRDRYQSAAEMLLDIEEFKRNPNVRFREEYVDNNPTRQVDMPPIGGASYVAPEPVKKSEYNFPKVNPDPVPAKEEYQPTEETYAPSRKKPILIGVCVGLMAVLLLAFAVLYFFTDIFNGSRVTVPNFINKNYEEEIKNNKAYADFNFVIENVQSSAYEDGIVFNQYPGAGSKIDRNKNSITLSVAGVVKMIAVPDVLNSSVNDAKKILVNKGFKVVSMPQTSSEYDFGTVISTDPAPNTEVEEGCTITVFYASDEKLIEVPEVVGWDLTTAEQLLISAKLEMDSNVVYKNSDKAEGVVIGQEPAEGEKVDAGTKVVLTVSNGIPETTAGLAGTAVVTVQLPSGSLGSGGTVKAYLNGTVVYERLAIANGGSFDISVNGSGEENTLNVYLNDEQFYTCNIDFTSAPAKITNSSYSNTSGSKSTMPNVVGKTLNAAKMELDTKGFTNYTVQKETVTDSSKNGRVLSQSPAPSSGILGSSYPLDTKITLVVGEMNGD